MPCTPQQRDLLFAVFLSGDGNFHLQLLLRAKGLAEDPSLFSDAGVWVPCETYENYVRAAQEGRSPREVVKLLNALGTPLTYG